MEFMRQCWEWMMALGWIGMVLGVGLAAALFVLVLLLIRRLWRGFRA